MWRSVTAGIGGVVESGTREPRVTEVAVVSPRQQQQPGERSWRLDADDTERHRAVIERWLRTICTQQTIPPREVEAEVGRLFLGSRGMMHAVHIRRDDDETQKRVE